MVDGRNVGAKQFEIGCLLMVDILFARFYNGIIIIFNYFRKFFFFLLKSG